MRKVALWVVCVAAGCGGSAKSTITIGALLSQTGTLATIGQEELEAAQMAVDEINAAGGVLDGQLLLVNGDDASDSTRTAAAATTLIAANKPVAIIGGIASGSTIAASTVTIPAGVVQISGASTSPALTAIESSSGTVFRTCPSDALQGQLLAKRAKAKGFTSVAVTFVPGPYGSGLADQFATSFTAGGGSVPFKQMYTEAQQSYASLLTSIYAATPAPQAILLIGYPVDSAPIIKDYTSAFASNQTFWFFTDATEDPSFVSAVGGSNFTFQHEGTGSSTPSTPAFSAYASAFQAKYGKPADPGTFSENVYDAAYLLAGAMQAGNKADAATIAANIRAVSSPPGMAVGPGQWAQIRAALSAGTDVNYDGASGAVDLDVNGETTAPYDIWKVAAGAITVVEADVSP
jgi:branched-chain amino acid transport system substrate-binding protein